MNDNSIYEYEESYRLKMLRKHRDGLFTSSSPYCKCWPDLANNVYFNKERTNFFVKCPNPKCTAHAGTKDAGFKTWREAVAAWNVGDIKWHIAN